MSKTPTSTSINEPAPATVEERDTSHDTPVSINEPPGSNVGGPGAPEEPPVEPEPTDAEYDEAWEREDDDANAIPGPDDEGDTAKRKRKGRR
jgi:hypothetical protein